MTKQKLMIAVCMLLASVIAVAQEKGKLYFTTGAGILKSPGALSKVLHPTLGLNSGIEKTSKTNWFGQLSFDFNSLRYDQQIKEDGSPFLFRQTTSSLIQVGINGGKNFYFNKMNWLVSVYSGTGYVNFGQPRLIEVEENIFTEEIVRKKSIFGRFGTRIAYDTKVKFLHMLYFDASWWQAPIEVQGAGLNGVSLFVGMRMGMN